MTIREMSLALVCAALLGAAANVHAHGYMALLYPVIELDDIARASAGGETTGSAVLNGRTLRAVLRVEKRGSDELGSMDYNVLLRLYDPAHPDRPVASEESAVVAKHFVSYPDEHTLVLDLRTYPSTTKTVWTFQLGEDGVIRSLSLNRQGGFFGGGLSVTCQFPSI